MSDVYEVISKVTIRREPRITPTNTRGMLDVGTKRIVYSTVTDGSNATWGRISESDAAGIAQWVCIKGVNRTYMKLIEQEKPELSNLERWAVTQGYDPQRTY